MAANITTTHNDDQNNYNQDTPMAEPLAPAQLGALRLIDPNENLKNIKIDKKCNPDHIPLPLTLSEFYKNPPLPYPAQWPYLMLNISISTVTELDNSILLDADWQTKGLKPLIEPIHDVEWVHILFLHPRAPEQS